MENMNEMNTQVEKKGCTAGIVLGIIGIIMGAFIPIIGLGCSVAGIIVAAVKKNTCKIKAALILSIIGCVGSIVSWIISAVILTQMMAAMGM